MENENPREIIHDGDHTNEALAMLSEQITDQSSLHSIVERAADVLKFSIDPIGGGGPAEHSYGLLYGLIQSGKTSIITVTAAMAADNGFKCILILTSDIDILYDQTLQRIKSQLRGLNVLGKGDWKDPSRFERQIRMSPFAIVCSKNSSHLKNLLEAFKKVGSNGARGLPTLIIDDEADQASLNTKTQKNAREMTKEISAINNYITELRNFFQTNTYLQVTATPQALFLQRPDGFYRPSFTVLSDPGPGYIGGEAFFEEDSKLLRSVDLEEVEALRSGHQPNPSLTIPLGLRSALLSFLVGATAKNLAHQTSNFSFLCHISHKQVHHEIVIEAIDGFREYVADTLNNPGTPAFEKLMKDLRKIFDDLKITDPGIADFEKIVERIKFLVRGASIKGLHYKSDAVVTLDHVYNFFVGGNKLGRGVTIKNLITSYYGRNPKRPNSDTVLQHARMYGYREKYAGVTRLFLPDELAEYFRVIHQMEKALRNLVEKNPEGKFEGIYIESPLRTTRSNVLDTNSIGVYIAGGYCNPRYPLRSEKVAKTTEWLDEKFSRHDSSKEYIESDIDTIIEAIEKCEHDPELGADMWNKKTITAALEKLKSLNGSKAYIRIQTDRDLNEPRRETQGFLSGGEESLVPRDAPTLFIYRLKESRRGVEVWWPMVRFPDGNYAMAFSFDR